MKELLFDTAHMAKEFCYYIGEEPTCMDNCFTKEPRGNKSVLVPVCKYATLHCRVFNEGTVDGWEFDNCELRFRAGEPLDRWLWAKAHCPYYKDIFGSFIDDYIGWLWQEGEE